MLRLKHLSKHRRLAVLPPSVAGVNPDPVAAKAPAILSIYTKVTDISQKRGVGAGAMAQQ